jgi:choline dehydrogenase
VLGGSSSINGLVYMRGQREDFDGWALDGWRYDDLLPYFRNRKTSKRGANQWHGTGGTSRGRAIRSTRIRCATHSSQRGRRRAGRRNEDFNGAAQDGVGYFQLTARRGRRSSTATGYLRPAEHRSNLVDRHGALTARVLFEGTRANRRRVPAGRESNRGAREIAKCFLPAARSTRRNCCSFRGSDRRRCLRKHGVPVVLDAPNVGEHLEDHFQARMVIKCTQPITLNDDMRTLWGKAAIGLRYVLFRRGPLTFSAGYACGFYRTPLSPSRPDVQTHFLTFSLNRMGEKMHPFPGFTASICQLAAEIARVGPHPLGRSARSARDPVQLSRRGARPAHDGRRHEDPAQHPQPAGAQAVSRRRAFPRCAGKERRRLARLL